MTAPDPNAPAFAPLSAAARRFIEEPRFAVIATINPDGSALQAVIWYQVEGDQIVFNSRVGRRWPTNLCRDARVSVTVVDGYNYVDLRGEVQVDENPETGQAVIADLTRRYHKDEEKVATQIAMFSKQKRVTFTLRPRSVFEHLSDD
jgi:PPOX class probable F420-dependent enzyme